MFCYNCLKKMRLLLGVVTLLCPLVLAGHMDVLYSWSQVDFTFSSSSVRDSYIASEKMIPSNIIVLDVDVWEGGSERKIFVTMPKFKRGVPATLATVTNQKQGDTTLLQPYPNWDWHDGSCDGISSVYRTRVDKCGRLWVLDSGVINNFEKSEKRCPPQLLVFDLHTDKMIRRHRFPSDIVDHDTLLITVAVDVRTADCSGAVAYMADVSAFKLFVYDYDRDLSWAITNNLFYPYPLHGDFHIDGVDFELMDGLFGLALGPIGKNGDRTLYFHSLAAVHESWVSTQVLKNNSLFKEDPGAAPRSFHVFTDTRSSQSAAEDMTEDGVLFYGLVEENAIGCWNSHLPWGKKNLDIIAKDNENLQFLSGLKVYGDQLWALSSRFQNYMVGRVPSSEVNYRILVGRVPDLLRDSRCQPGTQPSDSSGPSINLVLPPQLQRP